MKFDVEKEIIDYSRKIGEKHDVASGVMTIRNNPNVRIVIFAETTIEMGIVGAEISRTFNKEVANG